MGLFDRLTRIVRADLNALISSAEDPELILNQTIEEMGEELAKVRRAAADAMAAQKSLEQKLAEDQKNQQEWQSRAELALRNHDEVLAREAIIRKKTYGDSADTLQRQIGEQKSRVTLLQDTLAKLEGKMAAARTQKDVLITRSQSAKAVQALNQNSSSGDPESALSAFERMGEKVDALEALSESSETLSGDDLEGQFATLETDHHDVDGELAALKAQMALPTSAEQPKLES